MSELTVRQSVVLNTIKKFIKKHGVPPTYSEIAVECGMSRNGAFEHVQAIAKKGYIEFGGLSSRNIRIVQE